MTTGAGAVLEAQEKPKKLELASKFNPLLLTPEAVAEYFCSIYPRRDAFIWKLPGQGEWRKAKGPLLDHQILGVVSDDGRGLFRGTYWSHLTQHAVLDIDEESKYHNRAELAKLTGKLAAVGLSAKPYQSSDSGGWHVYLFFDDWSESSEVEQTLKTWLKAQGYSIESGQLEVFPSGNALRLPLQPGFAWLDNNCELIRKREEIGQDEALASFLCDLEENKRNWSEAKERIESQLTKKHDAGAGSAQEHRKAIDLEGFEKLWQGGQIPERIEEARHFLDHVSLCTINATKFARYLRLARYLRHPHCHDLKRLDFGYCFARCGMSSRRLALAA